MTQGEGQQLHQCCQGELGAAHHPDFVGLPRSQLPGHRSFPFFTVSFSQQEGEAGESPSTRRRDSLPGIRTRHKNRANEEAPGSRAGRRKPFAVLLQGDQGELYRACWQLSSQEMALLILQHQLTASSAKVRRLSAALLETHTTTGSSGVGVGASQTPVPCVLLLPLAMKEVLCPCGR